MSEHELQNTFIFIILLGGTNKHINSGRFRKFVNYSLFSNSVVISRLADLRGIPSKNIMIFAKGQASEYDMTVIPTTEIFFN